MKENKVLVSNLPSECTTMIVGQEMTSDGSMMVARSEDWDAMEAKNYEIYEDTTEGATEYVAKDSPFRCELPKEALGYSALAPYCLPNHWGSAGFNTAGVGMSATESIFSSDEVLKYDPLVENGIAENAVFNVVLPYIRTAREGVERLGMLIEKHGIAEGFGIGFVDNKEIWYLETACGHRWLACRMPKDQYFVTGNQSRFRLYDPLDTENYMASNDLLEFAEKHGLYDPKKGNFDFHEAYARDIKLDTTYNYPRVWGLQKMFSPSIKNDVTKNTFPVYAKAEKPISIADMRHAFRFHYDNTEHDPYLHSNPKEPLPPSVYFPHHADPHLAGSSRTSTSHWLRELCGNGYGRPWLIPSALSRHHLLSRGLHEGYRQGECRFGLLEIPQGNDVGYGELQQICTNHQGSLSEV